MAEKDLVVDVAATGFMCLLYVVLGFAACFCNILNLTIYGTNKELRKKYLYMMALDAGELVNGISYILVGSGRGFGLIFGYITVPITVYECYFRHYWVHSLILGTELPAYCIVLISVERMCAVLRPAAYKRIFEGKYKFFILLSVPFLGTTSVIVAGASAIVDGNRLVSTQHCPIISSTAIWYSTYHFVAITVVYVLSFFSLSIIKYRTRKYAGVRSEDFRIGMMLVITGVSIILVGSSAFVMITIRWNLLSYSDIAVSLTYSMPGFLSIVNTVVNLTFRKELKQQFLYLLGRRQAKAGFNTTTVVMTIAHHTSPSQSTKPSQHF
ncbi:unnamed protein product [Auanema sp. JU1783]|nr:unnamed protein product [Auanema sp. JU1783]